MKVWVVTYTDSDTEGYSSHTEVVGVFSSEEDIPQRIRDSWGYVVKEVEVDKTDSW